MENQPESKTISITPEALQGIVRDAVRNAIQEVADSNAPRRDDGDIDTSRRNKKKNRTLVVKGLMGGRAKFKFPRNWFGLKVGGK